MCNCLISLFSPLVLFSFVWSILTVDMCAFALKNYDHFVFRENCFSEHDFLLSIRCDVSVCVCVLWPIKSISARLCLCSYITARVCVLLLFEFVSALSYSWLNFYHNSGTHTHAHTYAHFRQQHLTTTNNTKVNYVAFPFCVFDAYCVLIRNPFLSCGNKDKYFELPDEHPFFHFRFHFRATSIESSLYRRGKNIICWLYEETFYIV